jgi:phytoene dehydrogenase-like protein
VPPAFGTPEDAAHRARRGEPDEHSRAQRLLTAWGAAFHRLNDRNPDRPPLLKTGADQFAAQTAARALGETIDAFPDGAVNGSLTHEFCRILIVCEVQGWARTFAGCAKMIGSTFAKLDPELRDPVIYQTNPTKGGAA